MRTFNNLPPTILLLSLISLVRAAPSAKVDQDYNNPGEPPKSPLGDKPNELFGDSSPGSFPDISKLKERIYGLVKDQMGTTMEDLSPSLTPDFNQRQDKIKQLLSFEPENLTKDELIRNSKKLQELGRTVIKLISDNESNQMKCDDKDKNYPNDVIKSIVTYESHTKGTYQQNPPPTDKYDKAPPTINHKKDDSKYGNPPTEFPTTPPKPVTPRQPPYESLPRCTPEMIKKNYDTLPTLEKETKYPDISTYLQKHPGESGTPYQTAGGYPVTPSPGKGPDQYGTPSPPLPPKNKNLGYSMEKVPTVRCQLPESIDPPKVNKPQYGTEPPSSGNSKYPTKPPSTGYNTNPPRSGYNTNPFSSGNSGY